jgi:hypothetical protein
MFYFECRYRDLGRLLRSPISTRTQILPNLAPIALREIRMVGFALNPYLIQIWTLTMFGFLMKGTPPDMRVVVIGETGPFPMTRIH